MLRMRNRFKASASQGLVCNCGRYLTHGVDGARETLIHQVPWCQQFRELTQKMSMEGAEMHVALMDPTTHQTAILADGDAVVDVDPREG